MFFNKFIKILFAMVIVLSQVSRSSASDNMEKLIIGIMGAALGSAAQKNANQKQVTNPAPIIQNNLVRRAQIAFQTLGFYTSTIDGKLGSNTMAAAQLYVDKYKQQSFSFAKNQDILVLESVAKNFVKIVPEPQTNSEFFGFNKVALAIGSYKSLGEVGLGITEFYQKNRLALSDVQFSIFSTNKGHYIITLGVGDLQKCKRIKSLGVRRKAIPSDSICTVGDGFKEAFVFKDGEIRPTKNWFALNLISVGVPPLNYGDSNENQSTTENLLARQTIEKEAKIVLTQLKDFVGDAGRFKKPVEISKLVASLEKEIITKDLQKITLNFNKLKDLLKSEELFITYQDKIALAAAEAKKKAVNRAIISLEKYKAFITNFVSEKPFDKKSTVLIGMGEEIDKALLENDLDKLIDVFDGIAKKLSALALYNDAQNFKITKTEDVEKIQAEVLATEALLVEATEIISAIKSYMEEGQKFVDVRGISRGFVKLKRAAESKENLAAVIADIKKVYETDEAFREFLGREKRAKDVAQAEALKEASDRVKTLTDFIAEIIEESPLLPNIDMLWEADDKAKDLLSRGDTALILGFYSEAMETLTQMSLEKDYDSYLARVELETKSVDVANIQAESQKEQLGIEKIRLRGSVLIADIEKYIKGKQSFQSPIKLARGQLALRNAQENNGGEEEYLEAIRLLELAIQGDVEFQEFRELEKQVRAAKDNNALTLASGEAEVLEKFIRTEISNDPLRNDLADLLTVLDSVTDAIAQKNSKVLLTTIDGSLKKLEELDLRIKFKEFKDKVGVDKRIQSTSVAKNGLAITALNTDILRGNKRDIIALENKTGNAPNILRDLSGSIIFSNDTASVCWAGRPSKIDFTLGFVKNTLKELGVTKVGSFPKCEKDDFRAVDIILLHRGTFLLQSADYASKLIQDFETEELVIFDTWFWEDTEEKILAEKDRSDKNFKNVIGGVLDGYGFITFDNSASKLCTLIGTPTEEDLHAVYLDARKNEIDLWISQVESRVNTSIEKAFAMAQKDMCSIIYADAGILKILMTNLEREGVPFKLSGLWVTQDSLAILEDKLIKEKSDQQRDLAKIRQEIEAQETLREELQKIASKQDNEKQRKLREEYSQEANGALNRIRYYLDANFMPGEFVYKKSSEELFETKRSFNRTFSKTASWWRIKELSLWELSSYSFEIYDYGTADWQGRRLETITGELNLKVENPALGRRDKKCLLISVMIDDEFNFLRDSNESNCINKKMISSWQKARNFESRWVAN